MLGTLAGVARSCSRRGPARHGRRLRRAFLALVVGAVASCGTGAAAPPDGTTTTTTVRSVPAVVDGALRAAVPPPPEPRTGALEHEVLLYGDSVAVLIADELAVAVDAPLVVDAVDCRRLDAGFSGPCGGVPAGVDVASGVDALGAAVDALDDPARAVAVVSIANNAALHPDDLTAAMAALGPLPRVWWLTTRVEGRAWQDPNNQLLVQLAEVDPRAGVIDWFAASDDRGWLVDNVHPGDEGQEALAELVAAHLRCDCTP